MRCERPFITSTGGAYGCSQCTPCRIKRRREWHHRIMLEGALNRSNSFVTLTYDDKHIPKGNTLYPKDLQDFMKRLRKRVSPLKVRFYAVGEYGDTYGRPHYHIALFGYAGCRNEVYESFKPRVCRDHKCKPCTLIRDTWGKGFIYNTRLTPERCRYIARYVVKKMTSKDDPRLDGRHPEFSRQSNRPGVGALLLPNILKVIQQYDLAPGDVPVTLAHGGKEMPLGRYLRRKLRLMMGRDEKAPQSVIDEMAAQMFGLRLAARSDNENPSLKYHILKANEGKRNQTIARERVFGRKGKL